MAEINTTARTNPGPGRRKTLSTRVDLTPMVDLGFLLITFFIFTTTMSDAKTLDLKMPAPGIGTVTGESTALTVIPLSGNRIFYYHGQLEDALKTETYGITTYDLRNGIGQVIRDKQQAMDNKKKGFREELMLMIKPDPEANYSNIVDMLDEVIINNVTRYALMDITEEEKNVIAQQTKF